MPLIIFLLKNCTRICTRKNRSAIFQAFYSFYGQVRVPPPAPSKEALPRRASFFFLRSTRCFRPPASVTYDKFQTVPDHSRRKNCTRIYTQERAIASPSPWSVRGGEQARCQNSQQLCVSWPLLQVPMGQFLQQGPISLPDDPTDGPYVSLYRSPVGPILLCHLWIQPFCHHEQSVWLLRTQRYRIGCMKKAGVVSSHSKAIEESIYLRCLAHIMPPPSLLWLSRPAPPSGYPLQAS